jgi:hypothetical protein
MKKKFLIVSKNVFTKYDYYRFKIDKLEKNFDVSCIDCSSLFFKKIKKKRKNIKNYFKIKNIFEYFFIINKIKPHIIFDQLGFSFTYKTIFFRLYANLKSDCLFYFTGPKKRISTFSNFTGGLKYFFIYPFKFLIILNNYLTKKIFIKFNFFNTIFLISSKYRENMVNNMISKKIIYFHSNDYDNYLRDKKKSKNKNSKYIVFIDENVPAHEDYQISNFKSPIDAETYYNLINNFFNKVEKKLNLKIVIALHPKSKIKEFKKKFTNRKVYLGKTQELIANSKAVFAHCSTSRSYAILNKKPIFYLTSKVISKTWFGKEIYENCKLTGSQLVNIDDFNINFLKSFNINKKKYLNYEKNFLRHPKSRESLFEDIINKNFLLD